MHYHYIFVNKMTKYFIQTTLLSLIIISALSWKEVGASNEAESLQMSPEFQPLSSKGSSINGNSTSKYRPVVCVDVPNWVDSLGDGCDFYRENDPDCSAFAMCCKNMGYVAKTACCHCGGGISITPSPTTPSPITVTSSPTKQNVIVAPSPIASTPSPVTTPSPVATPSPVTEATLAPFATSTNEPTPDSTISPQNENITTSIHSQIAVYSLVIGSVVIVFSAVSWLWLRGSYSSYRRRKDFERREARRRGRRESTHKLPSLPDTDVGVSSEEDGDSLENRSRGSGNSCNTSTTRNGSSKKRSYMHLVHQTEVPRLGDSDSDKLHPSSKNNNRPPVYYEESTASMSLADVPAKFVNYRRFNSNESDIRPVYWHDPADGNSPMV
jgi:hypothetical protein